MRILAQDEQLVFAATTIQDGDFAVTNIPKEPEAESAYLERVSGIFPDIRPSSWHVGRLCHGNHVERATGGSRLYPETDSLWTTERSIALCVTGADCPPVVLFDPGMSVMAIIHSGRKGTEKRIVANAVRKFIEAGSEPNQMHAIIGPGICKEHYEVSKEIARTFLSYPYATKNIEEKWYLDLNAIIAQQLQNAGIQNITNIGSNECTYEMEDTWHSARRDRHRNDAAPEMPSVQLFVAMMR